MRNESVYLTLAQILPTLLVAVAIEMRAMMTQLNRAFFVEMEPVARAEDDAKPVEEIDMSKPTYASAHRAARGIVLARGAYGAIGATFFVGEAAALAGPLVGLDGWFAFLVGPIAISAVALMCAFALVVPWKLALAVFTAEARDSVDFARGD